MKLVRLFPLVLLIASPFVHGQTPEAVPVGADSAPAADSTSVVSARPPGLLAAILDLDRNGRLSAGEIAQAPTILRALDTNEDGVLSPSELRRTASPRHLRSERRATAFNVAFILDANHDGDLQPMEIANAVSSLQRLDANHDGELTWGELDPRRPGSRA